MLCYIAPHASRAKRSLARPAAAAVVFLKSRAHHRPAAPGGSPDEKFDQFGGGEGKPLDIRGLDANIF